MFQLKITIIRKIINFSKLNSLPGADTVQTGFIKVAPKTTPHAFTVTFPCISNVIKLDVGFNWIPNAEATALIESVPCWQL